MFNMNQSNTDTMDQTNTTSSNLVELSDLGITEHSSYIIEVEIDHLDNIDNVNSHNNEVEQLTLQSNTDIENINQVNNSDMNKFKQNTSENITQLSMNTENLDQTTLTNILQSTDSTVDWSIHSENVVQANTLTGNLDQTHTDTKSLGQGFVQPNPNTESIDQVDTSNVIIEEMDQSFMPDLDQPSTSTGKLDEISSASLDIMLDRLGTSVEISNQINTNQGKSEKQEDDSVSQMDTEEVGKAKVPLFTEDTGPHWHKVVNKMVTLPVIGTNLPKVFKDLPIFGKPKNRKDIEKFYNRQIRDFVGCSLNDAEFSELQDYCSIDNLRTSKEFTMSSKIPHVGIPMGGINEQIPEAGDKPDLFVLRKLKNRIDSDPRNLYAKKLKYRGVRLIPMSYQEEQAGIAETKPPDLEPGKDVLYRIRVYRPFMFSSPRLKAQIRGRHSVFSSDLIVCGRQPLTALRDRLVCRNDADLRLDVSRRPPDQANTTSKDMFPSGFLFINNVFYVDNRTGCYDTSAVIRTWAVQRGLGKFPVRDMAEVNMHDVNVRIAHPEVYVHQGNCEHVFLVSEVRLLNYSDPLHLSCYPCRTAVSHNQTIYCTTCAEFGAKWIVTGCDRVPFDPAFFCDICFKQYLYKDGKKIGDFKAYAYKGNELSLFKEQS